MTNYELMQIIATLDVAIRLSPADAARLSSATEKVFDVFLAEKLGKGHMVSVAARIITVLAADEGWTKEQTLEVFSKIHDHARPGADASIASSKG